MESAFLGHAFIVRFAHAVQPGGIVLTSLSSEMHAPNLGGKPIMVYTWGVQFEYNGRRMTVGMANCEYIQHLLDEPKGAKAKAA